MQDEMFDQVACAVCESAVGLHVHHVDADHSNNANGNRVALCARCHMHIHRDFGVTTLEELTKLRALVRNRRQRSP